MNVTSLNGEWGVEEVQNLKYPAGRPPVYKIQNS
jgi:hypothetical protein